MTRIVAAGPERIDELRPLWLELHHHERVSRVQPLLDAELARRRLYERRSLVPGWTQRYRRAAAE